MTEPVWPIFKVISVTGDVMYETDDAGQAVRCMRHWRDAATVQRDDGKLIAVRGKLFAMSRLFKRLMGDISNSEVEQPWVKDAS